MVMMLMMMMMMMVMTTMMVMVMVVVVTMMMTMNVAMAMVAMMSTCLILYEYTVDYRTCLFLQWSISIQDPQYPKKIDMQFESIPNTQSKQIFRFDRHWLVHSPTFRTICDELALRRYSRSLYRVWKCGIDKHTYPCVSVSVMPSSGRSVTSVGRLARFRN